MNKFFRSLGEKEKTELGEKIVEALCDFDDNSPGEAVAAAIREFLYEECSEKTEGHASWAVKTAEQVMAGDYESIADVRAELRELEGTDE